MATEKNLTTSTDVIESYIFSTAGRDLSIYSERLLLMLVKLAQINIAGANFKDGTSIGQVTTNGLGEAIIEIPYSALQGEGVSTNYTQAREAIKELLKINVTMEWPKMKNGEQVVNEKGEPQYEFKGFQLLNNCEINRKPGKAEIIVNKETWAAILNFSRGFRRFELDTALKLKKTCSLRLFQILSNQDFPITFSIDQLREMWKMQDKYPNNSDFIKRTIEPAKAELDEKAPWTFDYVKNFSATAEINRGKRGQKYITSVTFIPKRKLDLMSTNTQVKMVETPKGLLGPELYTYLTKTYGFDNLGLNNNILLFKIAKEVKMDLLEFARKCWPDASRANNPMGYLIISIKNHLKENYGVKISKKGYQYIIQ